MITDLYFFRRFLQHISNALEIMFVSIPQIYMFEVYNVDIIFVLGLNITFLHQAFKSSLKHLLFLLEQNEELQ